MDLSGVVFTSTDWVPNRKQAFHENFHLQRIVAGYLLGVGILWWWQRRIRRHYGNQYNIRYTT